MQIARPVTTGVPVSAFRIQLPLNIVGVADIVMAPIARRDMTAVQDDAFRTMAATAATRMAADITAAFLVHADLTQWTEDASRTTAAIAAIPTVADITGVAFPVLGDTIRWTEGAFETTRKGALRLVGADPHGPYVINAFETG